MVVLEVPPSDPQSAVGDEVHARRGRLNNGNRPGDLSKVPKCGAKTRCGGCCRAPAMKNGRCRMHGGGSTGPRTPAGLEKSRKANWKHGRFSAAAIARRRKAKAEQRRADQVIGLVDRVSRLFNLLQEIGGLIDDGCEAGLRQKCVAGLKLWREYQAVLTSEPNVERERVRPRRQLARSDRIVTLMLTSGASGTGPREMRGQLAAALSGKWARPRPIEQDNT
jgi:hypothetical protein